MRKFKSKVRQVEVYSHDDVRAAIAGQKDPTFLQRPVKILDESTLWITTTIGQTMMLYKEKAVVRDVFTGGVTVMSWANLFKGYDEDHSNGG